MTQSSLRFSPDAWKFSLLSETETDILALKSELRSRKTAALTRIKALCRVSPLSQGQILSDLVEKEPSLVKSLFEALTLEERQAVFYGLGALHQQKLLASLSILKNLLTELTNARPQITSEESHNELLEPSPEIQGVFYVPFREDKEVYSGLLMFPNATAVKGNWIMIDTHKTQAGRSRVVLFEVDSFNDDETMALRGRDTKKYLLKEGEFLNAFGGILNPHQARKIGYTYYVNRSSEITVIEHYDAMLGGKLPPKIALRPCKF